MLLETNNNNNKTRSKMCVHLILHLTACETRRPVILNEQTWEIVYHPFEEPRTCVHHDERDPSMPCHSHGACCSVRERFYCYATPARRCQGWQWYHAVAPHVDEVPFLALFREPLHQEHASVPTHTVFHHQRLRMDLFDAGAEAWDAYVQLRRIHRAIGGCMACVRLEGWRWDDNWALMSLQLGALQAYRTMWMEAAKLGRMDPCPTQGLEQHPWSIAFQRHDDRMDYAMPGCPALPPVLPSRELVEEPSNLIPEEPPAVIPDEQASYSDHLALTPELPPLAQVLPSTELDASSRSWTPLAAIPAAQTSDSNHQTTMESRSKHKPFVIEVSRSPMPDDYESESCHDISSGRKSRSLPPMELPVPLAPVNYITPFQQGVAPGCRPQLSGYNPPVLAAGGASGHWTQRFD